jgi:hypothetical protein
MLLVFAFSITPTIVFHNWLADHTDTVKKITDTKGDQIGKKTFNCHCDNIVAESPFTEPGKTIIAPARQVFSLLKAEKHVQLTSLPHHFFLLRGPPVV